jgi:hypothetical protein
MLLLSNLILFCNLLSYIVTMLGVDFLVSALLYPLPTKDSELYFRPQKVSAGGMCEAKCPHHW